MVFFYGCVDFPFNCKSVGGLASRYVCVRHLLHECDLTFSYLPDK